MMDKLWDWQGWHVIKWVFGAFILWVVLVNIWYLETVKNYDSVFLGAVKQKWHDIVYFLSFIR